ncbi:MAG: DUF4260 domain-containing protein [Xanthobacteraceae bacterium]
MTTPAFHLALSNGSASSAANATDLGFVTGGVRLLLRLEGFAAFAAALAVYGHNDYSWAAFAVFFLAPDLSMLAYLAGPRAGALGYNLVHSYVPPFALVCFGFFAGVPIAAAGGLIWIAHIGFDRALGYGLKYQTAFGDTHLGRVGSRR